MLFRKTNRDSVRKPKKGFIWCISCDHQLVYIGQKCPVCGKKNGRRRDKPSKNNRRGEGSDGLFM